MSKHRLMTPGPTEVPETALLGMARQMSHHRTPEFRGLLAEVFVGLKYVFATENDVLVLASSGTGAMEAAVVNLVPRGGKAIVLESGKFAERWRKICETFGIEVVRYEVPWGEAFDPAEVARLLEQHPDTVAVFATLLETSTGMGHDIEAIGRVVGPSKALLVVDGISGVGAMECRTDAWGIDVLAVGAQKALMTPPGLAFLAVSHAAWRQIQSIDRPAFYFDLLAYREALRRLRHALHPRDPAGQGVGRELASDSGGRNRECLGKGEGPGPCRKGGDRGPGPPTRRRPARRWHDRRLFPREPRWQAVFGSARSSFRREVRRRARPVERQYLPHRPPGNGR